MLSSRERVRKALAHEAPDRAPSDYWTTAESHEALKRHLGIDDDEMLLRRLGVDLRKVEPRYVGPEHKGGGLRVSTMGIAKADGLRGEQIRVENVTSEKTVVGRVVNGSTVEVLF